MKKTLFYAIYALSPVPALVLYLSSQGSWQGAYSASVILGLIAFTLMCGQIILASRPRFAVEALGLKGLLSFHAAMPLPILALALAHRTIKLALGFQDDGLQAKLGGLAFALFLAAIALALLLMANTFLLRSKALKAFRDAAYAKLGLDYKKMRLIHNIVVAASLLLIVHVLLASSSSFAANPGGAAWMMAWLALSLGLYARYKLKLGAKKL
jgi:predicted ferric reductase